MVPTSQLNKAMLMHNTILELCTIKVMAFLRLRGMGLKRLVRPTSGRHLKALLPHKSMYGQMIIRSVGYVYTVCFARHTGVWSRHFNKGCRSSSGGDYATALKEWNTY